MSNAGTLAVEGLRLGGNIRGIFDIIRKFRELGFDLSKIGDIIDGIRKVIDADPLKEKVRAALELIQLIASATQTEKDDEIVDFIRKVLEDTGLIELLANATVGIRASTDGGLDTALTCLSSQAPQFEAKGINLAALLEIIRLVMAIVSGLTGGDE